MSPWITYSLARTGVFVLAFVVLYLVLPAPLASIGIVGYAPIAIIAATAAIISLAISFLFLGRLREQVAGDIAARRNRSSVDPDAADEDAAAEDDPRDRSV